MQQEIATAIGMVNFYGVSPDLNLLKYQNLKGKERDLSYRKEKNQDFFEREQRFATRPEDNS